MTAPWNNSRILLSNGVDWSPRVIKYRGIPWNRWMWSYLTKERYKIHNLSDTIITEKRRQRCSSVVDPFEDYIAPKNTGESLIEGDQTNWCHGRSTTWAGASYLVGRKCALDEYPYWRRCRRSLPRSSWWRIREKVILYSVWMEHHQSSCMALAPRRQFQHYLLLAPVELRETKSTAWIWYQTDPYIIYLF
jgi:hypothetical protein